MRLATIAVLVLAFTVPAALAHEGHAHHAMGVVKTVDASHVDIETTDGHSVSIALDTDTRYLRDKKAVTQANVKAGDRVAVEFYEKDGKKIAREVQLGTASADEHSHH
jgi:Cu/Ag efflux protein CusF